MVKKATHSETKKKKCCLNPSKIGVKYIETSMAPPDRLVLVVTLSPGCI